jgi:protein-tyrosine phosphatase
MAKTVKVLFVCLGNICRSPTAQAVFEYKLEQAALSDLVYVDSCGTAAYHIGEAPDSRAIKAAKKRNYRMEHLTGRQLATNDFEEFDFILAMDQQNLDNILARKPHKSAAHISLFLEFDKDLKQKEVPDPYYGARDSFEEVLDLIETASDALIAYIHNKHC